MQSAEPRANGEIGGSYARYVLALLTVVSVFNFVDRQILSILAPEIQRDLAISDADMSFLYGTAFAVFYAVFGIPLPPGRRLSAPARASQLLLSLVDYLRRRGRLGKDRLRPA